MLFQAQWLITIEKNQHNIWFLINASSEAVARSVCAKHSIAVFWLIPFANDPKTYGAVFFSFIEEKEEITIYTQFEKAREAFSFFRPAKFPITYINNNKSPISDEDAKRVAAKLESDYQASLLVDTTKDKWYFDKLSKMFVERTGQELNSLKQLAATALQDSEEVAKKIPPTEMQLKKKVKLLQEELKKVKLWSNESKIRDAIGILYHILEGIELRHLQEQKEHEISVTHGSVVTYLDVLSEAEKFENSKKVSKVWSHKSASDAYYAFLGAVWLYNKFLVKDIKNKWRDIVVIIDTFYSMFALFVLMTMIALGVLQLVNSVFFKWSFFSPKFIDLGLIGLCVAILMNYKKPYLKNLIILWIACVGLFFILRYLIDTTFWL